MINGSISNLDSTYGWVVHILLNRWQDCVRIEETVNEWKMQLLLVLLDILEENQRSHISITDNVSITNIQSSRLSKVKGSENKTLDALVYR